MRGLLDKSRAPKRVTRKATFRGHALKVRELQTHPLLGEFRMHAALKRLGIHGSPRICVPAGPARGDPQARLTRGPGQRRRRPLQGQRGPAHRRGVGHPRGTVAKRQAWQSYSESAFSI